MFSRFALFYVTQISQITQISFSRFALKRDVTQKSQKTQKASPDGEKGIATQRFCKHPPFRTVLKNGSLPHNFISIVSRNLCNFAAEKPKQEKGKSKHGFLGSEGFGFQAVMSCLCPEGLHVGTWGNRGVWVGGRG